MSRRRYLQGISLVKLGQPRRLVKTFIQLSLSNRKRQVDRVKRELVRFLFGVECMNEHDSDLRTLENVYVDLNHRPTVSTCDICYELRNTPYIVLARYLAEASKWVKDSDIQAELPQNDRYVVHITERLHGSHDETRNKYPENPFRFNAALLMVVRHALKYRTYEFDNQENTFLNVWQLYPSVPYRRGHSTKQGSKTLICISFTKLNIHLLLERVFLTATQLQANATKRLHKFRKRSHFSREAKRIYEKTCYSRTTSVVCTVTQVACDRLIITWPTQVNYYRCKAVIFTEVGIWYVASTVIDITKEVYSGWRRSLNVQNSSGVRQLLPVWTATLFIETKKIRRRGKWKPRVGGSSLRIDVECIRLTGVEPDKSISYYEENLATEFTELLNLTAVMHTQTSKAMGTNHPLSLRSSPKLTEPGDQKALKQCRLCKRTFRHTALLLRHQTSHFINRDYQCKLCPRAYKYASNLYQHMRDKHADSHQLPNKAPSEEVRKSQEAGNPCVECGKQFSNWNSLRRHRNSVHKGIRGWVCEVCEKIQFTAHLRIIGGNLYTQPCRDVRSSPAERLCSEKFDYLCIAISRFRIFILHAKAKFACKIKVISILECDKQLWSMVLGSRVSPRVNYSHKRPFFMHTNKNHEKFDIHANVLLHKPMGSLPKPAKPRFFIQYAAAIAGNRRSRAPYSLLFTNSSPTLRDI
ncbi:ecotropic virus integration site 1 protein [Clonorchis sinensis]|uniref:Ecotropic virus integration site 1 protein n=1 Tax=Clonorchis sinensis TaxID=79923 RepID=H2KPJ0_CLOSI|nr:ecotropic virus integration site 1 protein [Clonorchis sinensis]